MRKFAALRAQTFLLILDALMGVILRGKDHKER